mgnify:CR=1 FL=1
MRCVLPWLDSWAAKKPDAAAFEDEKTCLTWRQLHDTAKRIGTYLARQLPPRVPVALCMDKSPMTVAAMLGVLEAGCFYTIIDVQMPQQRVQLILDALQGDATLFIRRDEAEAAWALVTPIITAWAAAEPPMVYAEDSWGPARAHELLARDGRVWRTPEESDTRR